MLHDNSLGRRDADSVQGRINYRFIPFRVGRTKKKELTGLLQLIYPNQNGLKLANDLGTALNATLKKILRSKGTASEVCHFQYLNLVLMQGHYET